MKRRDVILLVLVTIIWGFNFVVIKFGLDSFSAPQLTALRFIVAALPIAVLPRPKISWPMLIIIGLTLFTGQFLLLFSAYKVGLPAGLASIILQIQVFFTIAISALTFRDRPTKRQGIGCAVAFCGLAFIGWTVGTDLTWAGLSLAVAAALSWATGNILIKRAPTAQILPLIAWLSLVPPLPALAVSYWFDQQASLIDAMVYASWLSIAAVIYLGLIATIFGYAIWADLLVRYPAALVAPFSLLVPVFGMTSSVIVLGETLTALRILGIALILGGLAVIVLPTNRPTLFNKRQ